MRLFCAGVSCSFLVFGWLAGCESSDSNDASESGGSAGSGGTAGGSIGEAGSAGEAGAEGGAAGAPAECVDEYPYDDGYTCAEQATWGKCDEVWLQGYCQLSCDRCGEDPDETSGEDFGGRRDVFTEFSAKQPLAPTPPMGWNSWNKFGCDIDEALVREIADAMVSSGMRDVGYEYVNIDDCWQARQRDADGNAEGLSAAACESVSGARKLKHQKRPPAPG